MFKPLSPKPKVIKNYTNKCPISLTQTDKYCPVHPARILITGSTALGKTNLLCNLIYDYLKWTKLYINAKDLSEPAYTTLREACELVQYKNKNRPLDTFYHFNNLTENIVSVDELDPKERNLIVFDDFITDPKAHPKINDLFIRSRKKNATIIYLSQSYFSVPKIVRLQCNYLIFFKIRDSREIGTIHQNYNAGLDKQTFCQVFNAATKDPYSFLLLDNCTTDDQLKVRKNLDYGLIL